MVEVTDYELRIANLLKVAELLLEQGNREEANKYISTATDAMRKRTYD